MVLPDEHRLTQCVHAVRTTPSLPSSLPALPCLTGVRAFLGGRANFFCMDSMACVMAASCIFAWGGREEGRGVRWLSLMLRAALSGEGGREGGREGRRDSKSLCPLYFVRLCPRRKKGREGGREGGRKFCSATRNTYLAVLLHETGLLGLGLDPLLHHRRPRLELLLALGGFQGPVALLLDLGTGGGAVEGGGEGGREGGDECELSERN